MTDLFLAGFKEQLATAITFVRLLGNIACAGVTGVTVNILLYPLDVVRTRMAKDTGRHTLVRKRSDAPKTSARGSNDTGYSDDTESKSIEPFQEDNNNTVKIEKSEKNTIF